MPDNFDQWLLWGGVLFNVCIAIVLIVTVLAFLAYQRVTSGTRLGKLLLIWAVAAGGSVVGSILVGILGYYLAGVNYPNDSESFATLLGAAIGMFFSIPIGIGGGGLAGTIIAGLLVYLKSWRPTLIASAGALVMGALVSGVALVPFGFFFWAVSHI
jgi:hypothetical protein